MHPSIQKILNLIDQNRIDEAFDEIESLQVPNQPLAQLRQEFEGGYFGVNSVQRLKLAVRSLDKRLSEETSTPHTPPHYGAPQLLDRFMGNLNLNG